MKTGLSALALKSLLAIGAVGAVGGGAAWYMQREAGPVVPGTVAVTIRGANGSHAFVVESAKTPADQERGLMYRTDLKPDGGMLFWPYPAPAGGGAVATFWMKNTPSPLDIVFIRADGTIARIAENTVPFSEAQVSSGESVAAVLELVGGRTGELGIAEGDTASWPGGPG